MEKRQPCSKDHFWVKENSFKSFKSNVVNRYLSYKLIGVLICLFASFSFYGQSNGNTQSEWVLLSDQNHIKIFAMDEGCSNSKTGESKVVLKVVNGLNQYAVVNFHLDAAFGENCVNCGDDSYNYTVVLDPLSEKEGSCDLESSELTWVFTKPEVNSPPASVRISGFNNFHTASLEQFSSKLDRLNNKKLEMEKAQGQEELATSEEYKNLLSEIEKLNQILSK